MTNKMKNNIEFHEPIEVYALVDKNKEDLKHSASGGAFMVFARPIIKRGGIVFGCVLEDDGTCYHKSATTLEELRPMQGSKYVRSSVRNTFKECIQALKDNKQVLYSGTPCQIASLYTFLKKHKLQKSYYDNLLTIDLLCHGTPSQKLFKQYIQWLSDKHKTDDGIHNYIFRSKKKGWEQSYFYNYTFQKKNKTHFAQGQSFKDPYYYAFLTSQTHQKQCYQCKYAKKERVADISIGDYWGIKEIQEINHKQFYINHKEEGISCILCNTNKAIKCLEGIQSKECYLLKSSYNSAKSEAICKSNFRKELYKKVGKINNEVKINSQNGNFRKIFSRILYSRSRQLKIKLSQILPNQLKMFIKNFLNIK